MSEITETELPTPEEDASEQTVSRRADTDGMAAPEPVEAADESEREAAEEAGAGEGAGSCEAGDGEHINDAEESDAVAAAGEALPEGSGDDPIGLWPAERLKPVLEAVLFAAADAMQIRRISEIIEGATRPEVVAALEQLRDDCQDRGFRLVEVAGGWQFRTAPEHHETVRKLFKEKPHRLTRAQMEVLTIIAYKQPVSRAELESVRGVDSSSVMEALVERRLVKIAGRRDVPGRPLVYTTTQEFLELFGLKDLKALPALPELGDDIQTMAERSGFSDESPEHEAAVIPLEEGDAGEEVQGQSEAGEAEQSDEVDAQDAAGWSEGDDTDGLDRQADGVGEAGQAGQAGQDPEIEPDRQDDSLEVGGLEDLDVGEDRQASPGHHEESDRQIDQESYRESSGEGYRESVEEVQESDQPLRADSGHSDANEEPGLEQSGEDSAKSTTGGGGQEQGH